MQMIEEITMAVLMSIVFAIATYFLCEVRGSFALFWLIYTISLSDGIGGGPPPSPLPPPSPHTA